MAIIEQGILGGYSGRVGTVVGYYRMGKWCVRAYQPTINDAKSPAQLQQRSIFKEMIQMASRCTPALRLGLRHAAREAGVTEGNLFLHINSQCFNTIEGGVSVDYRGLKLSRGTLPGVQFSQPRLTGGVQVEVDYETPKQSQRARGADLVYLYAYSPSLASGFLCAPATRRAKHLAFVLPDQWAGQEVHFYGFTLSADGTASTTTYLGTATEPLTEETGDENNTANTHRPDTTTAKAEPTSAGQKQGSPDRKGHH